MTDRARALLSFLGVAVMATATGCAVSQQSRFRTAFLPPASREDPIGIDVDHAPLVESNAYLKDVPPLLLTTPPLPPRQTRGDVLIQRAETRYESGKRFYDAQQFVDARREFDTAVDLMLQASSENPTDHQAYDDKMDRMVDAIHRFDLAGFGASATASDEAQFEKAPLEDILQMTFPVDPKLKGRVLEQVKATVSQLPLSVNNAVLGYINYFANRGHRTLVAATERSGRYRSMIQRVLNEEGVPQELIHLAQAESGFIPRAMSRASAGGMWQFLSWRGKEYGLERTAYVDDRMDPEKATRAAARHLHDLYNEFGDWYLALAAYNCGPGVVESAVERTGYADFWELRDRGVLPLETTNYVPIILAFTIMEKNPSEYGLTDLQYDPAVEYDTIKATAPTSMALVSDITDVPVPELAALNPSILKGVIPADYALHVPKGQGLQVIAALDRIPEEHRAAWRMHRVAAGDTLASIASRYGTTAVSLANANKMSSAEPHQGDFLVVPAVLRATASHSRTASRATVHRTTARRTTHKRASSKASVASKIAIRQATITAGTR
jgi:membrane-bound lytic murein transglycosylase D